MIRNVSAREIVNSRGHRTIEVEVLTDRATGRAAAPSGASTGKFEVTTFPKSVAEAVETVNTKVNENLRGKDETNQVLVDSTLKELDGTSNFANIGGSPAIGVSMAVLKSAAKGFNKPLGFYLNPNASHFPYPLGNAIGGGAHGGGSDIQEFLFIPAGAKTFPEAVFQNAELHAGVKKLLAKRDPNFTFGKNDEGAWTTRLPIDEVFSVLVDTIEELYPETKIGLDVAASSFFKNNKYIYEKQGMNLDKSEQIDYILDLVKTYPIIYVEDPLEETDFEGFAELNKRAGCLICGDDLTVTNTSRLEKAIEMGSCNSVIVKPNQIGTITDTLNLLEMAKNNSVATIVSHRSGETTDATIAHLALASESLLIKTGITGGERIAKLNELIRLWSEGMSMVKI